MNEINLLISAEELAESLGTVMRVVDCRFNLMQPDAGRAAYLEGHIPGAVYAHLDDDLAAPVSSGSGRHPLPAPEEFAATLGRWGISNRTDVVVYDDAGGAIAARLWWLLRWSGHNRVRLLDGGIARWVDLGHGLETGLVEVEPASFRVSARPELVLETAEIVSRSVGIPSFFAASSSDR